jgi:hypothetical protein
MQTQKLEMDRDQARALYRKYREHRAWSKPIDHEIQRIYQLVAQGKIVIRALDSIRAAGVNEAGFPKLAIARADVEECFLTLSADGSAHMGSDRWSWSRASASKRFAFPPGTFPVKASRYGASAIVPHIPPDIRPARGLANYHILWEAEWTRRPPVDPMLLRRIGKGDLWLVLGAWDLTEVERAVMAEHIGRARQ